MSFFAGTPAIMLFFSSALFTTTALAPILTSSAIETSPITTAPMPISTRFPIKGTAVAAPPHCVVSYRVSTMKYAVFTNMAIDYNTFVVDINSFSSKKRNNFNIHHVAYSIPFTPIQSSHNSGKQT